MGHPGAPGKLAALDGATDTSADLHYVLPFIVDVCRPVAYVSGSVGTKSVGLIVWPGHAIHLGRDAVEQGVAIFSDLI